MNNCSFKGTRDDVIVHLRSHSAARATQRFDTLFSKRKTLMNTLIALECNLSLLKPDIVNFETHAPWNEWVREIASSSGLDTNDPGVTVYAVVQLDGLA
jgi:hypothetical protein